MYAVIQSGSKQYIVNVGDQVSVEKLDGEIGGSKTFSEVLAIGGEGDLKVGAPFLTGAKVEAEISEQIQDKKIIVFKKKRRKGYHKKQGHRQSYTILKIKKIYGT